MSLIELHHVTRRFGAVTAVDAVDLHVGDGEVVGLLGHNGAGKTTLIRVINGLLQPDEGRVVVDGLDPVVDGHAVRSRTGVLTEYPALDEHLTVRENLEVYAAINGIRRREAKPAIDLLLGRLGLTAKARESARDLSAGLKQRVALARGLVHGPSIWLLDEPTTNLDPVAAREVRGLIVESARERNRTVLLSTHNLAEAEALCDRVAIMRNGRLLVVGPPRQLRRDLGRVDGAQITTDPDQVGRLAALVDGQAPPAGGSPAGEATSSQHVRVLDGGRVEVATATPIPQLVAAVVQAGVAVHAVVPLEPTLEDLYVALHAVSDPSQVEAVSNGGVRATSSRDGVAS